MGATPDRTDAELWLQVRRHDGAAFGELFDRHHSAIYAHGVRRLEDPGQAEDLVSLTFLEAWRMRSRAQLTTTTIRPWLLAICNNVIANQNRTYRRHRRLMRKLPLPPAGGPSAADSAFDHIAQNEVMRTVWAEVAKLPDNERSVVDMCDIKGYSQQATAEALGIPIGTVKSRLHRGRLALKANIESDKNNIVNQEGRV